MIEGIDLNSGIKKILNPGFLAFRFGNPVF